MRPLGKLQVTANSANDNKFILIANIFLITLVLTCLLRWQSSPLVRVLCGRLCHINQPFSSWVTAAGSDFTFLVTQLSWAPFVQRQRETFPTKSSRTHGFAVQLQKSGVFKALGTQTKKTDVIYSKLCFQSDLQPVCLLSASQTYVCPRNCFKCTMRLVSRPLI